MMAKKTVAAAVAGVSIDSVRTHALELLALADTAEQAGETVISGGSLVETLQKLDDVARNDLVAAINEAKAAAK